MNDPPDLGPSAARRPEDSDDLRVLKEMVVALVLVAGGVIVAIALRGTERLKPTELGAVEIHHGQ